jgi:hypothetical protein
MHIRHVDANFAGKLDQRSDQQTTRQREHQRHYSAMAEACEGGDERRAGLG